MALDAGSRTRAALEARPAPVSRRLSGRWYGSLVGAGAALAALQLLLLQRRLGARELGVVLLGVSATQGILQFGDLGLSRLCIDRSRPEAERASLRRQGHALTLAVTSAVVVVCAGLTAAVPGQRPLLLSVALGALAGAAVSAEKFRATASEAAGAELAAAVRGFKWTNAPKIGLVLGLVAFRDAVPVMLAAVVVALAITSPGWASPRLAAGALTRWREWVRPFAAIVFAFVLMWSDTYFLALSAGVAEAGAYEALFRVLGICTYAVLPAASAVSARANAGLPGPLLPSLLRGLVWTLAGLAAATWFLLAWSATLFPQLTLPLAAVPALWAFYLLSAVSYCVGTALLVAAGVRAVARAAAIGAGTCLVGHLAFTLGGGPQAAATVTAFGMAANTAVQVVSYRYTLRRGGALA